VLAVVFGLSMDYEVFLLSRIRERFAATGDTRRAVAEGLAASAGTISSAALIMVGVFGVFVAVGVPSIQQIGLGTAVAIALDATLVRLVLVPAAMELMGRWNWYLPRGLDRILPRTSFEHVGPVIARG
jgi:RND superfamily putative drug exporter